MEYFLNKNVKFCFKFSNSFCIFLMIMIIYDNVFIHLIKIYIKGYNGVH